MNANKPMILAIHGAGMHAGIWGGIMPHLLDYPVRAVSLPGHDVQKGGDPLPTIAAMSVYVREKLADMALAGPVTLMGHSMGGLVAMAASEDPLVSDVILLGCAAEMPVNGQLLSLAAQDPAEAERMIVKWGIDPAHPQADAVRTVLGAIMESTDPRAIGADLKACNDYADGARVAAGMSKPTLVVSGLHDKLVRPAESAALAASISGAVHAVLQDCGHMMMVERPIETSIEIKRFLQSSRA